VIIHALLGREALDTIFTPPLRAGDRRYLFARLLGVVIVISRQARKLNMAVGAT
jgi:hypothetical protein